ncbi:MAG: MBL fold metallo-hydrolase [Acidimicrobiia bacterium]|nr:MBL fold metallo-hydrolase [Acidimicrobiia bacterium]
MIRMGPYSVYLLDAGRLWLDGGAMFGVVPKALWSQAKPSDERNRIELSMKVLLLCLEDRKILVDVGAGHTFPPKLEDIYGIDYRHATLKQSLAEHRLQAEDITDVILTHCHFDHMGGAAERVNGSLRLTFPNATHYVQASQWKWALNPSEKDRGSFIADTLEPLKQSDRLKTLPGECELFPGLHLLLSNGHTVGLQMVKIQDSTSTLFYCGDLMPTAAHVPLPYIMGYDIYPLTTLEEKKRYLNQACEENWLIVLEHDTEVDAIRLKRGAKRIEVAEKVPI